MKKLPHLCFGLLAGVALLIGCRPAESDGNYLEVIGEYEQPSPEAGYRLNLAYNGPLSQREGFEKWVDSVQQKVPGLVKISENIYVNYMPEEMGRKPTRSDLQTSISYMLNASDSTLYNRLANDLLKSNLPFSLNVMGTYLDPATKTKLQQDLMQKALANARQKIESITGEGATYQIVQIEELDNTVPYGPEYYDFNRRMVSRIKVKARLD